MAAGIHIGKGIDTQRNGMRAHMQTVCQQGHGTVGDAGDYLYHHHGGGYGDHHEGAELPGTLLVLAEAVGVSPAIENFFFHGNAL